MNNSRLAIESIDLHVEEPVDKSEQFRAEEARLVKIIESLQGVQQTSEWSSLKELIFDGLPKRLKSELLTEAKRENPDTNKLNRITGELKWADKFSDLKKLEDSYRVELTNVRIRLHA